VTRQFVVEADGGSRGNPGPAGYGALVRDAQTGELLTEIAESIGRATNNVAEYSGLVAGLRAAADLAPGADVEVRMDSKLVVEQMSGRWQIKHPDLRPLAAAAREAARRLGRVSYHWVPRARNTHADRLANKAMDEAQPGRAGGADRPGTFRWEDNGSSSLPEPVTTVLLRHGQTPLSDERRFAGRADIPLTETGLRQAEAVAQRLAARGGIDAIVTSPLRRARDTADAVASATGAPVRVDDAWMELDFGEWEGLSYAEAAERWPAEMAAWLKDSVVAPPGGESIAAATRRVLPALGRVLEQPPATVLVVSHVTPMKIVLRHALLAPPPAVRRMHLDVACLCEIDWFDEGLGVVRSLNDTGHLQPRDRPATATAGSAADDRTGRTAV
jgi:broad specificity phosphatase PhoE/ribonuclease HI